MLQNIKSSYFIKLIFTFVEEAQKLKLIRYNKSIQKNLDISIINQKHINKGYIIYESNGFGKEYNGYDDKLIFEGEYLNGKRNGKGKEYNCWDGKLRFEGEYLNDKEWIGTRYDYDGNILYELNNSINGKGKEYNCDGKLLFEGEYLNGEKNGKGKEYYEDSKLRFEGEYKNDKKWNGIGYDLTLWPCQERSSLYLHIYISAFGEAKG